MGSGEGPVGSGQWGVASGEWGVGGKNFGFPIENKPLPTTHCPLPTDELISGEKEAAIINFSLILSYFTSSPFVAFLLFRLILVTFHVVAFRHLSSPSHLSLAGVQPAPS